MQESASGNVETARTFASAGYRHWSGRAVRWSSCAILLRIAELRGQLLELGSAVRQLNQFGFYSAAAQLLLVRKRAELEDLMKLAKRN